MRLLPLMLLVVCCCANAKWELFGKTPDQVEVFLDFENITKQGSRIRIWELRNFSENEKPYRSTKAYIEFDCQEKTKTLLQAESYSEKWAKGNKVNRVVLDADKQKKQMEYLSPDSIYNFVLLLCPE